MAPEIIDLTVDSPPPSPTHPHRSNPSSSTASDYSAVVMPNHQPRRPPGRRPRSTKYDYEKFIWTEQVNQQSLTGTAPVTAGPSRPHLDSNVDPGSGNQNMQQSGQNLPDLDALWTEKEHDLFVEGLSKCGSGNWTGIAEGFVKTKTPQQICKYNAEYFRLVRSTASRATRYIEKQSSQATAVGSVKNRMDTMVYVAPRAKNYASRNLRRLVNRGLGAMGGLQNHRTSTNTMVHNEPSEGRPALVRAPLVVSSAPEQQQQLVPVPAPNVVIPVSVSVSNSVPAPIATPRMKAPQMFRQVPAAEGPVPLLEPSAERGSSTASSVSCDHGDGEVEDENGLDLELTLGWRFH